LVCLAGAVLCGFWWNWWGGALCLTWVRGCSRVVRF
jgi:hypothetical protein